LNFELKKVRLKVGMITFNLQTFNLSRDKNLAEANQAFLPNPSSSSYTVLLDQLDL
jgi:hypothetical protein